MFFLMHILAGFITGLVIVTGEAYKRDPALTGFVCFMLPMLFKIIFAGSQDWLVDQTWLAIQALATAVQTLVLYVLVVRWNARRVQQ
jgi:Zn-dependent protease with chaperone function